MRSIFTFMFFLFLSCNSTKQDSKVNFGSTFSLNAELDIEFSNEMFIDSVFQNKQIILLGELDHGDGSSFDVKSRLVKYLHEERGFNTLFLESSLINCHYFNTSLDTSQNIQELSRETIYHIWSEVEETQNLFKYIESQSKTDNPLKVVGIDPQFSGRSAHSIFIHQLKSILPESNINSNDFDTFEEELKLISKWLVFPKLDDHKISKQEFIHLADQIESIVVDRVEKQDKPLWIRFFDNIKVLAEIKWIKDKKNGFRIRDEQMYQNLESHFKNRPNEKCIVWAANGHIIRNDSKLKGDTIEWKGIKKLGDYIHENYKSKAYSIGITSYQGKTADWYYKKNDFKKIKKPEKNSLEFELKNFDSVFLDLSLFEKDRKLEYYESQLLYTNVKCSSTWSENFDGVIYLKTMKPSRKIKTDNR